MTKEKEKKESVEEERLRLAAEAQRRGINEMLDRQVKRGVII